MIDPGQFARALVDRLAPILPAGFVARAEGDAVRIDAPDGMGSATSLQGLLDRDEPNAEDYASAAWMVLSLVQDVVSETTTEPWPAAMGPDQDLAEPGTRAENGRVLLYYGDERAPVIALTPIPLE